MAKSRADQRALAPGEHAPRVLGGDPRRGRRAGPGPVAVGHDGGPGRAAG